MKEYTIEKVKWNTIPEANYQAVVMPDTEDCSTDTLPLSAGQANGKRKILVPELTSMTKYLFDPTLGNQRLPLYSYLNRLLRTGRLSSVVGFRVMDKSINKDVCSFPGVSFWKIDRENFYADVEVKLLLKTRDGIREWMGVLECTATNSCVCYTQLLWSLLLLLFSSLYVISAEPAPPKLCLSDSNIYVLFLH